LTELAIDHTSFASASFGIRIPADSRQALNRMAWHVYILRNERNALYTGVALNPIARYKEHLEGGKKAAKYTRSATSLELVYSVEADSKSDAYKIESAIKRLRKDGKEHIVAIQPDLPRLKGILFDKTS
jgi:putative endonuclease